MGGGTGGGMRLTDMTKRWVQEHRAAAVAVGLVLTFAFIYGKVLYVDQDQDAIQWVTHITANDPASGGESSSTKYTRQPTKYRMLNPMLYYFDYPVCRFLTFDLGMKDFWWMSANLISLVHPVCGITAAFFMIKSASTAQQNSSPHGDVESADLKNSFPSTPTTSLNLFYVRVAAILFQVRNTLDTMDGVVARAQRAGKKISTGLEGGFNGHTLDVITDMTGVTIYMISVWFAFYKVKAKLDRHPLPGIKQIVEKMLQKNYSAVTVSRVLVFFGVAMICLTGATWETFMLKMQNHFDNSTDPQVHLLERSVPVQAMYYLWAFTCSDAQFTYLILALLTGVAHEWLIFLAVYGWSWIFILAIFSSYVNYTLTLNPLLALPSTSGSW